MNAALCLLLLSQPPTTQQLLDSLGHDRFRVREEATLELIRRGEAEPCKMLTAISLARFDGDPERRSRAWRVDRAVRLVYRKDVTARLDKAIKRYPQLDMLWWCPTQKMFAPLDLPLLVGVKDRLTPSIHRQELPPGVLADIYWQYRLATRELLIELGAEHDWPFWMLTRLSDFIWSRERLWDKWRLSSPELPQS